uniref:MATH domain-containing protein n=1 Tax=Arundo donax TaxID=35708 RepID=A0A0A8Z7J9_ARUDO
MQFPVDLTETECKVCLLTIRDCLATKALFRSWRLDYIPYGEWEVGGCDWDVRYYPNHSDISKDWIAFSVCIDSQMVRE